MPSAGVQLVLYERNDETVDLTITNAAGNPLDLTGLTLEVIIKAKTADQDSNGFTLSTATGEIVVTDATGGLATVTIAGANLATPGKRVWRCDVIDADERKTAMFGSLQTVDL